MGSNDPPPRRSPIFLHNLHERKISCFIFSLDLYGAGNVGNV
jgi:hypothetical protein